MKKILSIPLFTLLIFSLIYSCNNTQKESSFLNPNELDQIENLIKKAIDENYIPGAVVLVAKNNQVVYKKSFGIKNPETNDNYQVDDIFRIASMTKAITSVGVMKLWERGLIGLDDPIENYIPEFKNVGILDKFFPKDSTFTIKSTKNKITVRHLLTHTSGLGYGFIDGNPKIKATYEKEKSKFMPEGVLGFSDSDVTIEETIRRIAKMPLHHEPGERYTYAIGIDVLGYLTEIISGQTLSEFLEKEIFRPLEMKDTYFYIPEEKKNRLVPVLTKKEGQWSIFNDTRYNVNYPVEGAKKFYSGGAGLSSTVEDYYKFLSIFLNDGAYKSKKIISHSTNQLIQKDQLIKITNTSDLDLGHGLISGIIRESDVLTGAKGSEGTIFWGGYFNTDYFADPNQKIIGIIYKQTQLISEPTSDRFNQIIYGALQN
tara:strand:+ start:2985 stop:4271 length:1287 start_codon:yes stop_codon:yes gene_type:complete